MWRRGDTFGALTEQGAVGILEIERASKQYPTQQCGIEHLQLPRNPIHPHIKVPYLRTDHYDGGPFLQYLDRTGWTTSQILDASQHQNLGQPKEEVQALLQTWFFFGLLTGVFGIQIEISDFVTLDQRDQKWISTKNLNSYTERWIKRESVLGHKS